MLLTLAALLLALSSSFAIPLAEHQAPAQQVLGQTCSSEEPYLHIQAYDIKPKCRELWGDVKTANLIAELKAASEMSLIASKYVAIGGLYAKAFFPDPWRETSINFVTKYLYLMSRAGMQARVDDLNRVIQKDLIIDCNYGEEIGGRKVCGSPTVMATTNAARNTITPCEWFFNEGFAWSKDIRCVKGNALESYKSRGTHFSGFGRSKYRKPSMLS